MLTNHKYANHQSRSRAKNVACLHGQRHAILRQLCLSVTLCVTVAGCATPSTSSVTISYVGSSTVGQFLLDADPAYQAASFEIDTSAESEGGAEAIRQGRTDLAGVARQPQDRTLQAGVRATAIGHDAIAVIVHKDNPIRNLSLAQLKSIFTGRADNWRMFGGPDLAIRPRIVAERSATRHVFRNEVMGEADYAGCTSVEPDSAIVSAVASDPSGIGQISFSFLRDAPGVRTVSIDGQEPTVTNLEYPIARPLYLLWREGNKAVADLVAWTQTVAGQRIVMQRFVGTYVVGAVGASPRVRGKDGTLIVFTETYPSYDGGIYYYPKRSYDVFTKHGAFIQHVRNRTTENDESPQRVRLSAGTYLIRAETSGRVRPEFLVTVESGRTTEVRVEDFVRPGP